MTIHYDSMNVATEHLVRNGWHQIENGNWVSRDGTCAASVHPIAGVDAVCVGYWEI